MIFKHYDGLCWVIGELSVANEDECTMMMLPASDGGLATANL